MRRARLVACLGCLALLSACGAGGLPPGANTGNAPIAVSVSPLAVTVPLGSQRQFTATVLGGGPTGPGGVVWSVATVAGGSINSSGLYTAPMLMPASPLVQIVATSTADPTKSANASVTLSPPIPPSQFPVPFDVATQGGWQNGLAPVTAGLPLRRAMVSNENTLRIQTQTGLNRPAQFRVTSRWEDGSIRWLLCDFIADLSGAGGVGKYQLNDGGSGSATVSNLSVINGTSTIEVRTGLLAFVVNKVAFRLFESVRIDRDSDGQVDDECLDTAAARGIVISEGGNEFRTDQLPPTRIEVEETGPVRCTLVAEGLHRNASLGQDKLHYIIRITAWADLPLVKVSYSFKNMTGHGVATATPDAAAAQLAQFVTADAINLDMPLQFGAASLNALVAGHPMAHPAQSLTGGEFLDLLQVYNGTQDPADPENPQPPGFNPGTGDGSSEPLENCWPDQSDAQIGYNLTGKLTASGQRSPGWMQLAANSLRFTAALREFWQMYPKQMRLQDDGLARIGIWPEGTWPLQVFAGSMRTHEVLFSFESISTVDPQGGNLRAQMLNDPPTIVPSPAFVATTGIHGRVGTTNAAFNDTTDYLSGAQAPISAYLAQIPLYLSDLLADRGNGNGAALGHEYGMWNFGDGKTFGPSLGWENNDWEISRACLSWHAASGNIPLFRLFDATTRHFRDVNVLHADIGLRFDYSEPGNPSVSGGKASQLGKTRFTPNNKQHDLGNYHFGESHLDVFKGAYLAEHYLMTGDRLSLDVMRECFSYLRGTWKRHFDPNFNGVDLTASCPSTWLSHALYFATAYEVANASDPNAPFMRLLVLNVARNRQNLVSPNDPVGNGFADNTGQFKAWQVGHMLEALEYTRGHINDATLDQNIHRCLTWLFSADAGVHLGNPPSTNTGQFAESPGGGVDFGGANLMIGAGYVGTLTFSQDVTWQTRAQHLLVAQNPKVQFAAVGDDGARHSTFAQFFRAGPMLLAAMKQ